jgi:DNA-binding winged helix-turn-helix (wHTH) protein/predicted ATPase
MAPQHLVQFGPYRLDGASGQLWHHTQVVKLPPKAAAVLWCLVRQAGQVVVKDTLLDTVWAKTAVSEGVLSVCIRDLRRALGDDPRQPRYIETVHRRGYRFIAPVEGLEASLPAPRATLAGAPLAPPVAPGLVGRDTEVAQVQACLERARGGQRQVLFVTGEAGIGKTTLVEACVAALAAQGAGWVGWGQCVDAYGPGTGYLPVLEALGRLCRGPAGATVLAQLQQWAPAWLAQLPGVLEAAEQARLLRRTQGTTRERMFRELAEALEALTQAQLGVLVLEDLHWSDPSTVEVLSMLARRREAAQLVILGTYRPVELILRAHPLKSLTTELHLHGHCEELTLRYLQETEVTAYVAHCFPAPVAQSVAPVIYRRTAGHPLFMVHLAAYLAEQAEREASAEVELAARVAAFAEAVPSGVQQLIKLQLGHLSVEEQRILAMASVVGVEFAVASVAAGLETSLDKPEAVCEALAQRGLFIEERELAVWPDGTVSGQYRFRHAVYQQVLYRQVAEARRVQGHRRIGARLEAGYGTRTAEIAPELAVHFEHGWDYRRAVQYVQRAAESAARRSAPHEVIVLVTKGLELLATLPETPARAQQELALQIVLGPALIATKGTVAPEVEQTYARARVLCAQAGETPQLFPILRGLCLFYRNQGALSTARELAEQLFRLARRATAPTLSWIAHESLGSILFYLGEYAAARAHLEQGNASTVIEAQQSLALHGYYVVPEVWCLVLAANTLWCLGYPAQALWRCQEALTLAQALAHPFGLALARHFAAYLYQRCQDTLAVQVQANALLTLATAQEFPLFVGYGIFWDGWVRARQGQGVVALTQMHQGMAAVLATGQTLSRPLCLVLLAEAAGRAGQVTEGMRLLAEALAMLEASGRGDLLAETYRLQGVLLLAQKATRDQAEGQREAAAEACFQHALTIARRQQARSWELRTAISLACLWQQQGKHTEAYELLAPSYNWFTEGFDTADLQEARALLEDLA